MRENLNGKGHGGIACHLRTGCFVHFFKNGNICITRMPRVLFVFPIIWRLKMAIFASLGCWGCCVYFLLFGGVSIFLDHLVEGVLLLI